VTDLPLALYTCQAVKSYESVYANYELMCRAGQAAFNILREHWPDAQSLALCAGVGNNGGDGFVLARLAHSAGLKVTVYQVGEGHAERLSVEAKSARKDWLAMGTIIPFQGQIFTADVIVDAVLGTGMHAPLAPQFAQAISAMNASKRPIFSIDVPSGLNADTGVCLEPTVNASATVTFIALKIGLLCHQGVDVVGALYFDALGLTIEKSMEPTAIRLDYAQSRRALSPRPLSAHKGDNGHVVVIGGGQMSYSGAPALAGEAALRVGAGLVSVVVAPESIPLLARGALELMCYGPKHPKKVQALLNKATVLVLGPGLTQTAWAEKFFQTALGLNKSLVIDADGLNILAHVALKRANWVLTPHPAEAARLLNQSTASVQQDRIAAAKALHKKYGGVIVLKGAGTIIFDGKELFINGGGFPILATGGTGDILAGLIGGLAGQGLSLLQAAKIAVCVHTGAAALEQSLGVRGMVASDLFLHIRDLINV